MATKPTTPRKPAAATKAAAKPAEVVEMPAAKPKRTRKAKDSDLVFVPGVGTTLPSADEIAAAVVESETSGKPAAAKRSRKPAAAKPAAADEPAADEPAAATLADLTAVQAQIDERGFAERRDADDPLMIRRNELILSAIEQGAGFAAIARARGVSTSTNRGLIRVLQGGKRI